MEYNGLNYSAIFTLTPIRQFLVRKDFFQDKVRAKLLTVNKQDSCTAHHSPNEPL